MTDVRRVLIDTDTGVDDALALLTVLDAPQTELIGVGSVFGNCTERQAASNALVVLAAVGRVDIPVCVGRPRPGPAPTIPSLHGADGLGDRGLRPPDGVSPAAESAVEQILRIAREQPGQVDLLCLGPLSNVAAALEQDSLVLTRYRTVTIMGGMGPAARQDTNAAVQPLLLVKGDTNTNHDPVATAAVAAARGPVTWVGMNATGRLHMPWADLDAQAAHSGVAAFVRDITADYHLYCTTTYQADTPIYTCHDSVAAGVMLDPAVVRSAVELTGRVHRGDDGRASLWGHRAFHAPTHRFITDLDYSTIRQRITETFSGAVPH